MAGRVPAPRRRRPGVGPAGRRPVPRFSGSRPPAWWLGICSANPGISTLLAEPMAEPLCRVGCGSGNRQNRGPQCGECFCGFGCRSGHLGVGEVGHCAAVDLQQVERGAFFGGAGHSRVSDADAIECLEGAGHSPHAGVGRVVGG